MPAVVLGVCVLAYVLLSGFARRPLRPPEFVAFSAAMVRATPAHLGRRNPLETLRLGGTAFGSPAAAAVVSTQGETYTVPLPPRTARSGPDGRPPRFVTFATADELYGYLHSTLPRAGWAYREQLGNMHRLDGGEAVLSLSFRFHAGTRIREVRLDVRPRRSPDG
jgi:hypothetical protein